MTTISFFGAAGTVTGSCSLVDTGEFRFIVDGGMFQGNKTVRRLNYEPPPFDPTVADFLLLTHAHIDHSGLLPKLVKNGFKGQIYCTGPTADLAEIMLLDSARIQESQTERENRKRRRRGRPLVELLYEDNDVKETLRRVEPVAYGDWFRPLPGISVRGFWRNSSASPSGSAGGSWL